MTMRRHIRQPRGIALLLVVAVIGIASIMAYAMLSHAALQAQASGNAALAADAEAMAESGVNLACYYLQHPERAPVLSSGVYPGQTGISFGHDGSVDISVSRFDDSGALLPPRTYQVTSIARAGPATRQVQRTLRAIMYVDARYDVRHALATNTDFTLPALLPTVEIRDDASYNRGSDVGLVRTDGHFQVDLLTSVLGKVSAASSNLLLQHLLPLPAYPARAAPTRIGDAQLTLLKNIPYYTYNGQVCQMEELTADLSNRTLTTMLPNNPLNVFYARRNLRLSGTCRLTGTLILAGDATRDLNIRGLTTITAKPDPSTNRPLLPALIVDNHLIFNDTGRSLDVTGLVWIGGDIRQNGSVNLLNPTNNFNVRGALMLSGSPSRIDSSYTGSFTVTYSREQVQDLWDLCEVDLVPHSVKVLSWGK